MFKVGDYVQVNIAGQGVRKAKVAYVYEAGRVYPYRIVSDQFPRGCPVHAAEILGSWKDRGEA